MKVLQRKDAQWLICSEAPKQREVYAYMRLILLHGERSTTILMSRSTLQANGNGKGVVPNVKTRN